jgi:hypothetical protein
MKVQADSTVIEVGTLVFKKNLKINFKFFKKIN